MQPAETIYHNAVGYTMDDSTPTVEALLVRGDRIAATGTRESVENAASRGARRVDLQGRTVVPGFNDSHCHILHFGLALDQVDVSADAVRTIEDIKRAVRARAASARADEWVIGRGYDQNTLAETRHPARQDLDEASPHRPVVLRHTSGHVLTCNSRALERAGVTAATNSPFGGEIDRDEHGKPTGLMKESATELIDRAVPEPSIEQGVETVIRAMREMTRFGITSASDAATGNGDSIDPALETYRRAAASGKLAGRVTLMPQIRYVVLPESGEVRSREDFDAGGSRDWLDIGPTKIFSDGALSTRTAALRQPYADDLQNRGILLWQQPVLMHVIARAHAAGWQIATHALGDRAVEAVVEAYEAALASAPRRDHRHRIEHCMIADEPLARRIKNLGVVPSLQPDIFRLGDGYVAGLGLERASASIPVGLFRRLGVSMAFSSDSPVIPCDPLRVIRSAVERKTPRGISLGHEHSATVMEGIRLYTRGGAFATHTDGEKGSLAPGMLADFAVLSADPSSTPIEDFDSVRVVMTVTGGAETFQD